MSECREWKYIHHDWSQRNTQNKSNNRIKICARTKSHAFFLEANTKKSSKQSYTSLMFAFSPNMAENEKIHAIKKKSTTQNRCMMMWSEEKHTHTLTLTLTQIRRMYKQLRKRKKKRKKHKMQSVWNAKLPVPLLILSVVKPLIKFLPLMLEQLDVIVAEAFDPVVVDDDDVWGFSTMYFDLRSWTGLLKLLTSS